MSHNGVGLSGTDGYICRADNAENQHEFKICRCKMNLMEIFYLSSIRLLRIFETFPPFPSLVRSHTAAFLFFFFFKSSYNRLYLLLQLSTLVKGNSWATLNLDSAISSPTHPLCLPALCHFFFCGFLLLVFKQKIVQDKSKASRSVKSSMWWVTSDRTGFANSSRSSTSDMGRGFLTATTNATT